jgi:hypothetical protein
VTVLGLREGSWLGIEAPAVPRACGLEVPAIAEDPPLSPDPKFCDDVLVTLDEFKATLKTDAPPPLAPLLRALWHDAKGNWGEAHRLAQDVEDADGAWVHAYLHRKEGDVGNARYWYSRARQPEAGDSLESEWARLVTALLSGTNR